MELCVGIDLGTTNSVLAVVNEKPNGDLVSKVVDLSRAVDSYAVPGGSKYMYQKKPLLPSYVYYRPESEYSSIVGDYAKGMYAKRPHLVVKSIKSQMGNAVAEGMVAEIPDKTPARISSRILMHMLNQASKIYHQDIRDAVITVPANFDAAMCKATLEAAAMAGVIVRRPNGTEKPILLSEPNAVIYDLINQIRNGEVHASILDLSEPRQVMVFDIGGGTLDITLHTIKWRDEAKSLLKVDEIATNRYTLLGGDDFDEVIAKEMFNRYLAKYEDSPAAVEAIRKEQTSVMAQLRIFAEGLKLELSNRKLEAELGDSAWGWDDEEEEGFAVGGHMGSTGFAYDDYFTTEEIEGFLEPFMGRDLVLDDYKRLSAIKAKERMLPPNGSLLRADYEINSLIQLCRNWEKYKNPNNTSAVKALTKIRSITKGIRACRNPQDFGRPMLEALMTETSQHARLRLYGLIRRICTHWTEQEQRQLADACMSELALELLGIHEAKGARVNTLNAAIMTLAKCGSDAQIVSLGKIQDPKLRQGMMYTLALRQENPDWLYQQFVADAHAYLQGKPKSIQESARSLGLALSQYNGRCAPFDHVSEALTLYLRLCRYESHVMTDVTRCTCISALGWICDQRTETARAIDSLLLHEVRDVLQVWNVEGTPYQKCCLVAEKMINGLTLDESDEKYLLSLVEAMETD